MRNSVKYYGFFLSGACSKTEFCTTNVKGRSARCKRHSVRGRGTNDGVGPEEEGSFL